MIVQKKDNLNLRFEVVNFESNNLFKGKCIKGFHRIKPGDVLSNLAVKDYDVIVDMWHTIHNRRKLKDLYDNVY